MKKLMLVWAILVSNLGYSAYALDKIGNSKITPAAPVDAPVHKNCSADTIKYYGASVKCFSGGVVAQ